MNRLSSKQRKFVFLGGILVLLIPIILLGMPGAGADSQGGGKLSELRNRFELGENQLGKIDATSAAMNLVLLGFRGLAADLIWLDFLHNEDIKNWAEMRSNADAIITLQPHFVKVWQYQGWNLAWNVSAAWDLVADRYYWIKEGAKFYMRGCKINDKVAQLPYEVGRVFGQKIGRADEWRFYRKFFIVKDPDEERWKGEPDQELNPGKNDNYLVAKEQYYEANRLETKYPTTITMMPVLFRGYPYRSQLSYADALQREGLFDDVSREAWRRGYEEWTNEYGREEYLGPAGRYRLNMTLSEIEEQARIQKADLLEYRTWIQRIHNETRFPYWKVRALVEHTPKMVEAHKLAYDGQQEFKKGNLVKSRDLLFRGMTLFNELMKTFPVLATEDDSVEEALSAVLYWRKILQLQFKQPPAEYPLSELWAKGQSYMSSIESRFKRETGQK